LERRRIAKRQAAALAERKRKAAISIALNEKRKEKLKVTHSTCRGYNLSGIRSVRWTRSGTHKRRLKCSNSTSLFPFRRQPPLPAKTRRALPRRSHALLARSRTPSSFGLKSHTTHTHTHTPGKLRSRVQGERTHFLRAGGAQGMTGRRGGVPLTSENTTSYACFAPLLYWVATGMVIMPGRQPFRATSTFGRQDSHPSAGDDMACKSEE